MHARLGLQGAPGEEEPEPHVDPEAPVSTVALLMGAVGSADLAVALDWARTMLDHLHSAAYHPPRACAVKPLQGEYCRVALSLFLLCRLVSPVVLVSAAAASHGICCLP